MANALPMGMSTRAKAKPTTFSLVTWNMRGATGSGISNWTTPLQGKGVWCLQECGRPEWIGTLKPVPFVGVKSDPVYCGPVHRSAAYQPWVVYLEWTKSVEGNPRCSLAIVISKEVVDLFGSPVVNAVWTNDPEDGARPILYVILGGKLLIATMHAPAGGGAKTIAYVAEAEQILTKKTATAGILAGDFNTPPATGVVAPAAAAPADKKDMKDMKAVPAAAATHARGKLLDYVVCWGGVSVTAVGSGSSGFSDHVAQKFNVTI